jgi:peptidoglycan/xylan/chitin deacetylase (PgdA/CDA1 family)
VYHRDLLRGAALPERVLCLTYDDGPGATAGEGPGPRTLELAAYLADEGIRATFFMTGAHVALMPDAPADVAGLGHLVGNHTLTHPDLGRLVADGGDAVAEVVTTDALIRPGVDGAVYLRPPYGSWSPAVADQLNAVWEVSTGHVGPVGWDIDGSDWSLWELRVDAAEAARRHLDAIDEVGSGIVLMHDSTADSEEIKQGNAAYATTRILVPELRRRGYSFVPLEDVPLA